MEDIAIICSVLASISVVWIVWKTIKIRRDLWLVIHRSREENEDYIFQWTCPTCDKPSGSKRKIGCSCENIT